jgi:hypothetical protein
MVDIDAVKRRFESLLPAVDERMRRLIAAAESLAIDYGGISIVSRATGVSRRAIARDRRVRHELGYSLQANAKTLEGSSHPDRNAQFEHIHRKVQRLLKQGQPVISVDTKKKEES